MEATLDLAAGRRVVRRGFKLFRVRKDGSLGPLFINCRQRVPVGEWLEAEFGHRRPGFAYRPGWHASSRPEAPHLSTRGRVWAEVALFGWHEYRRPDRQGGVWFLSQWLKVVRVLPEVL